MVSVQSSKANELFIPETVKANSAFEVTLSATAENGDLIRIASADGTPISSLYWYPTSARNGALTIRAPIEAGVYEVLYYSDKQLTNKVRFTVVAVQALISAPASAKINSEIEVSFTGPDNQGDTLRFRDLSNSAYVPGPVYVGNTTSGRTTMVVPTIPGKYELVYLTGNKVIGRALISVDPVTATISTKTEVVAANDYIEVSFTGPENKGDYIQFVDASGKPVRGHYSYVNLAKEGTLSVRAPISHGNYTLEYFTGVTTIGTISVSVRDVIAKLTTVANVSAGAHFMVAWTGPNNAGDRVDIVQMDGTYTGSYAYPALSSHELTLRAPETPGDYKIIYRTAQKIIGETTTTVFDVSAELTADAKVPANIRFMVQWVGPGNYGDSVQLFVAGQDRSIAWEYVNTINGNTVMVLAPEMAGDYTLKYVTHGHMILANQEITITPAEIKPGFLVVDASPHLNGSDAIELVLDASGSMLKRENGERRIDIAKRTLGTLLRETIPEGTPLAMRVFGHQEADKCRTDLEITLGPLNRSSALSKLKALKAMNLAKTPIAESLRLTAVDLQGVTGERIVVLVTDGEETCEGEPADVIATLRRQFTDLRFNIVGYAIADPELRQTFDRWATLGGGKYFDTSSEAELSFALTSSLKPAFSVVNADGVSLAAGIAGDERLTLAPGSYKVVGGGAIVEVKIVSQQLTSVTLD